MIVLSRLDYDPFGMLTIGRTWQTGSEYKYGFNGKESDSETYGNDNFLDFSSRVYDSRLGRFLSVDPLGLKTFWKSPYSFAGNSPILYVDYLELDINGGFSVENNSQQPVILVGNGEITTKTITMTPQGPVVSYSFKPINTDKNGNLLNTYVVLEPNQKFVVTVEESSSVIIGGNGSQVTIVEYRYSGKIIDMNDGTVVEEDVNIYDVDGIDLLPNQSITTPNGEKLTEENALNDTKGEGYVRYDSDGDKKSDDAIEVKFESGEKNSIRAASGLPPIPTNDSVIVISGTTSIRLDIREAEGSSNDPSFRYSEIKN